MHIVIRLASKPLNTLPAVEKGRLFPSAALQVEAAEYRLCRHGTADVLLPHDLEADSLLIAYNPETFPVLQLGNSIILLYKPVDRGEGSDKIRHKIDDISL